MSLSLKSCGAFDAQIMAVWMNHFDKYSITNPEGAVCRHVGGGGELIPRSEENGNIYLVLHHLPS